MSTDDFPENIPDELVQKYGTLERTLGQGTYGSVWQTSGGYAVKIMTGASFPSFLLETSLMQYIQSPYCMPLEDAYVAPNVNPEEAEDMTFIVMPLGRGLGNEIPENPQQFFRELVRGVMDLHAANVIHGDLKPQNYVDFGSHLRLTDFGISSFFTCLQPNLGSEFQTMPRRSPSLLLGGHLRRADDVWALGIILYQWMTDRFPFEGLNPMDHLFSIFKALGTPTKQTWPGIEKLPLYREHFPKYSPDPGFFEAISDPEARDLVEWMFEMNPSDRPTIFEVFQHPFVGGQPSLDLTYSPKEPPSCVDVLQGSVLDDELKQSFRVGTDMNAKNFNILADWLADAAKQFKMTLMTFGHAIFLLRFAATHIKVSKDKIRTLGCTAVYLSNMLNDQYGTRYKYVTNAADWEWISAKDVTSPDLFRMVRILMEKINFDLIWSSPTSFVLKQYNSSTV